MLLAEWKPYTLGAHKAYHLMRGISRNATVFAACQCTAVYTTYDRGRIRGYLWLLVIVAILVTMVSLCGTCWFYQWQYMYQSIEVNLLSRCAKCVKHTFQKFEHYEVLQWWLSQSQGVSFIRAFWFEVIVVWLWYSCMNWYSCSVAING